MAEPRSAADFGQAYLKERLHYDPTTGVFTWRACADRTKQWNSKHAGKRAGSVRPGEASYKRRCISIDRVVRPESRLAWLYMTGEWPEHTIDHINHDALDNRWSNLRDVEQIDNMHNQTNRKSNTSGVLGVGWVKKRGAWQARIGVLGGRVYGGCFKTFEEAVAKRKELEKTYDFHPNHGAA